MNKIALVVSVFFVVIDGAFFLHSGSLLALGATAIWTFLGAAHYKAIKHGL